jgi:hypothetical protein
VYTGDPLTDVPGGCKGQEVCNQCFYGAYGRLVWPNNMYLSTEGFQRDGNHDFVNVPVKDPIATFELCVYQWYDFSDWIDPGTGMTNNLFFALANDVSMLEPVDLGGSYTVNNFVVLFTPNPATMQVLSTRPYLAKVRLTGRWYANDAFDRGCTIWISEEPL